MEFYVTETRNLAKDGTPNSDFIMELRVSENNNSESYDISVTSVHRIEEARELVQPENLLETLRTNLSESESNMVGNPAELDSYKFYDETLTFKGLQECECCCNYKKDVKIYDMRTKGTDEFMQNISLCDACADNYNEEDDYSTISLPVH